MTQQSKDRAWLQGLLTSLLEHASQYDEASGSVGSPDHGPCSKYAELLLKILPAKTGRESGSDLVSKIRESLETERQEASEARDG